jgi:hypothetical protein
LGLVLVGIWVDPYVYPKDLIRDFGPFKDGSAIIGVLVGSGLVLASGYIIGVLSTCAIWVLSFLPFVPYVYDAPISNEAVARILRILKSSQEVPNNVLPPVAVFDFASLNPEIHEWIQRRWQVLLTSINCTTASFIGLSVGWFCLDIRDPYWIVVALGAIGVFALHAYIGWRDTKAMLEFQSYGPFPVKDAPK